MVLKFEEGGNGVARLWRKNMPQDCGYLLCVAGSCDLVEGEIFSVWRAGFAAVKLLLACPSVRSERFGREGKVGGDSSGARSILLRK